MLGKALIDWYDHVVTAHHAWTRLQPSGGTEYLCDYEVLRLECAVRRITISVSMTADAIAYLADIAVRQPLLYAFVMRLRVYIKVSQLCDKGFLHITHSLPANHVDSVPS